MNGRPPEFSLIFILFYPFIRQKANGLCAESAVNGGGPAFGTNTAQKQSEGKKWVAMGKKLCYHPVNR